MSQCSCLDSQPQTKRAMTLGWTSSRYAATSMCVSRLQKAFDSMLP